MSYNDMITNSFYNCLKKVLEYNDNDLAMLEYITSMMIKYGMYFNYETQLYPSIKKLYILGKIQIYHNDTEIEVNKEDILHDKIDFSECCYDISDISDNFDNNN